MCALAVDEISGYRHGRVPRAVRERQVLRLAGELFAERGYHDASMDELASRAGVSKPVIYDLVGSKEELFRVCCRLAADELAHSIREAVQAHEEPAARLHAGAVAAFRFAARHRRAAAVLFPEAPARFADEALSMRRRQAQLIAALLVEEGMRQGVGLDPRRTEAVAHGLVGAFEGLALWWRDHPDIAPETLADWMVALTEAGLRQITAVGSGERP